MSASSHKSLASRAQKFPGTGCLRLFFLLFLLVGATLFFFITGRPALQCYAARQWQQTPCVIDSSRVVASPGKSTTYSIEIVYHYFFAGETYTSKRYSFAFGSTGGRKPKASVVERFPPGTETSCYVNSTAPQEAVIDRGFQPEFAFGAFGLLFAIPGVLGIIFASGFSSPRKGAVDQMTRADFGPGGPGVLKPSSTPLGKFVGMLIFTLVWNGFIGVFVYLVFFAEDAHSAPFFAKAVISILALVGILAFFGVFHSFLALFNPRIQLTAPATSVPLGGELPFTWTVTGRAGMLRKLRIVFEGREESTYKRGTRTSTDTRVFAEIPVFETAEREFLAQGSARVAVPANLMHTFEAGRNKVLWRLKVHGEIPRWPDVADEYPINVLPRPRTEH